MNKLLSKLVLVGLVFSSVTLLNTQKTFAQSLNLFGFADNGPYDLDPTVGSIVVEGLVGQGRLFLSASAREIVTATSDTIILSPFKITNTTNDTSIKVYGVVSNNYQFSPGNGSISTSIHNVLVIGDKNNKKDNATLDAKTTATTFDNNFALASDSEPGNDIMHAFQQKNGNFSGAGQLIGSFSGTLYPGQSLFASRSGSGGVTYRAQVVPVPSSLYGTLAVAALGAGAIMRRNLRRNRSIKLESIG
jgi:hypothetical protein